MDTVSQSGGIHVGSSFPPWPECRLRTANRVELMIELDDVECPLSLSRRSQWHELALHCTDTNPPGNSIGAASDRNCKVALNCRHRPERTLDWTVD